MKHLTIALLACVMSCFTAGAQNTEVKWDKRSIIINGRPVLPVMGELHYARVPEAEWRREIQKMKAGGVTMMATYVFWNHHEDAEPGVWNWNGNRNLRHFVELCGEEELPVVLRVGPFCHGEAYQGGLPCWIVKKSIEDKAGYRLRSLAPGFIDATAKLYNQIGAQVRGLMWKDGGPIIAVQLENECHGPWPYFTKLLELAHQAGLDTPIYTRTGWPAMSGKAEFGKILPLYGDYGDGFWARELTDMPGTTDDAFKMKDTRLSAVIASEVFGPDQDTKMKADDLGYPYLTCELGGGMMQSYHRRLNMNGREAFPLAVCKLGSGSNLPGYYMYHGGTNPTILGLTVDHNHPMGETQNSPETNYNDLPAKSYDFQAILGEMGRPDPISWHETRWVHQFLKDWGEELSQMDVDTLSPNYARRGQFVFRNDYVRIKNEGGSASITPCQMQWQGLTITSDDVQPFAKADGQLYFITAPKAKSYTLNINKKKYTVRLDKPLTVGGQTLTVLSPAKARQAYVIDGHMYFGDGILYRDGDQLMQEVWEETGTAIVATQTKREDTPRTVPMGRHGVAHQPENEEFDKAALWTLDLSSLTADEGLFLEIAYAGDVARVYADDQLVEDNFWNGKPMVVRVSDLIGKRVELKILPLRKDAPIYLQQEQRDRLEAAQGQYLLALDGIKVIRRTNRPFQGINTRLTQKARWRDTDGNFINAHSAGILEHNGTYYWYGENKGGVTAQDPTSGIENVRMGGVNCYSSRDLLTWKFEGVVLKPEPSDTASDLHPSKVIERPKVIYNKKTKQFVMWVHAETGDYAKASAGVAVSKSPTGPFRYLGSFRPNGAMSRDQTLFVDDDGTAYQICSSEENKTLHINRLTPDYLRPDGTFSRALVGLYREAPAVFKHNGKYYLLSSGCSGWKPNEADLAVADSMLGEWTQLGNPCTSEGGKKTYLGQSTYVQPLHDGRFIAMFDEWHPDNLSDSRYFWLPIKIDPQTGRMTIPWKDRWQGISNE